MRRALTRLAFGAVLLALHGCATVSSITAPAPTLPPIAQGQGRIVFYRTNFALESQVPDIVLNGQRIGRPLQRGMFWKDVPPGSYAVTTTIASDIVNFHVNAGQRVFVKLNPGWGLRIAPVLVEAPVGEQESAGMAVIKPR